MCGLCLLVRHSQRFKKSDLSVFDTQNLSDQITKKRSALPIFKSPSSKARLRNRANSGDR